MLFNEPKLLKSVIERIRPDLGIRVSVLFNEPKLLKFRRCARLHTRQRSFSALQRAEIAEITPSGCLLCHTFDVSVLFNEPKLLKLPIPLCLHTSITSFSALQRAEIAEILGAEGVCGY